MRVINIKASNYNSKDDSDIGHISFESNITSRLDNVPLFKCTKDTQIDIHVVTVLTIPFGPIWAKG